MSLHLEPDPNELDAQLEAELDPARWPAPSEPRPVIRVTAVLVAHDGAAFLPRTLDAVYAQTRRPDQLVGVDVGSVDHSGDLLAIATPHLLHLGRDTSFGDAVAAALVAADGPGSLVLTDGTSGPGSFVADSGAPVEWLWLLHDDCAPAPDCLARLLEAVDGGPSIGIAGCKQVSWDDGRKLVDVGFTVSRLGARVTGIDVDDVDQGQLDHRSDVLAVGTAGMLVRRDAWERLGGMDPVLAHARDDLDLCRRAHLSGLRVVVVPRAVVAHAAATASGRREPGGPSWALRDRQAAIHLRLAASAWFLLPLVVAWLAVAAVTRAAGRLVLKQPERAAAELTAFGWALGRPVAVWRARRRYRRARRLRASRRLPRQDFRRLLAGRRATVRQRRDALSAYLRRQDEAWASSSVVPEPEPEAEARPAFRVWGSLAVVALGVGLAGLRLLLRGTGVPVGPGLIPAPGSAGEVWALARSGWRPVDLGVAAAADPFGLVLAGLSWVAGGSTRLATEGLLIGALPLAALSAWWAAGVVTRSRALRAWAALGWCCAPSLLVAVSTGRVAAVAAHLALPPAALMLVRLLRPREPGHRRAAISSASALGLLLALVLACSPSLALPVLLVLLVAGAGARRSRGLVLWAGVVPAVLLAPWLSAVVRSPSLLLSDPAPATGAPGSFVTGFWPLDPTVLLGSSGLSDRGVLIVAGLFAVPLLALGLVSVWQGSWHRPVALWLVGVAGLALAGAADFAGPGVSLFLLCVVGAALRWLNGAAGRLRARRIGWRHWLAVGGGLVALAGPIATAGVWVVAGWNASPSTWVHRASPDVVPAVAAAEAESPAGARTLVLRPGRSQVRWSLYRAGGPRFGYSSAAVTSSASPVLVRVVGGLVSDTGADLRSQLADLDIGSVFLLASPDSGSLAQALDSAPGLVRVTSTRGGVLWRVELSGSGGSATRPARVRVLSPSGVLLQTLPSQGSAASTRVAAGAPGRLLVLSESFDPGWSARLSGHELVPVRHAGWAQAFRLPAGGGSLSVTPPASNTGIGDVVRPVVLVVAVLLAVPLPGRRRRFYPPPGVPSEIDLRPLVPTPRSGAHVSVTSSSLELAALRPPKPNPGDDAA